MSNGGEQQMLPSQDGKGLWMGGLYINDWFLYLILVLA